MALPLWRGLFSLSPAEIRVWCVGAGEKSGAIREFRINYWRFCETVEPPARVDPRGRVSQMHPGVLHASPLSSIISPLSKVLVSAARCTRMSAMEEIRSRKLQPIYNALERCAPLT